MVNIFGKSMLPIQNLGMLGGSVSQMVEDERLRKLRGSLPGMIDQYGATDIMGEADPRRAAFLKARADVDPLGVAQELSGFGGSRALTGNELANQQRLQERETLAPQLDDTMGKIISLEAKKGRSDAENAELDSLKQKYSGLYSQWLKTGGDTRYKSLGQIDELLFERGIKSREMGLKEGGEQDAATKDAVKLAQDTFDKWKSANDSAIRGFSKVKGYINAFNEYKKFMSNAKDPASVYALVKIVNKLIEPDSAVMGDEVRAMLGMDTTGMVEQFMQGSVNLINAIKQIPSLPKADSPQEFANDVKQGKITDDMINNILRVGDIFSGVAAAGNAALAESYGSISKNIYDAMRAVSKGRYDALGKKLEDVLGRDQMEAIINAGIPAGLEIKGLMSGVPQQQQAAPQQQQTETREPLKFTQQMVDSGGSTYKKAAAALGLDPEAVRKFQKSVGRYKSGFLAGDVIPPDLDPNKFVSAKKAKRAPEYEFSTIRGRKYKRPKGSNAEWEIMK